MSNETDPRRAIGLLGRITLITDEDPAAFLELANSVYEEYKPQSPTELRLAESVIHHYWLTQRAIRLQGEILSDDKKLALFLRYQTVHERSYYKAQKELVNLQKEKAKEKIGFESQNQKQEAHEAKVRLTPRPRPAPRNRDRLPPGDGSSAPRQLPNQLRTASQGLFNRHLIIGKPAATTAASNSLNRKIVPFFGCPAVRTALNQVGSKTRNSSLTTEYLFTRKMGTGSISAPQSRPKQTSTPCGNSVPVPFLLPCRPNRLYK